MRKRSIFCVALFVALFGVIAQAGVSSAVSEDSSPGQQVIDQKLLIKELRHELTMLPQYSLFDWIEFEVQSGNKVVLRGQVRGLTLKADAESTVKRIEGVTDVVNQIEDLPLSSNDDSIRKRVYHAVYDEEGPLFRYAIEVIPTIHIIVKNGTVTLKGVVDSASDSNFAYAKARGVADVFSVKNELKVEKH